MDLIPSLEVLRQRAADLPGCSAHAGNGSVNAVRGWGHGCADCAERVIVFVRELWPEVGSPLPGQTVALEDLQ